MVASDVRADPHVTVHVWRVAHLRVPAALLRQGLDRAHLRRTRPAGLGFAKLLGTGSGRTFGLADADPTTWAMLATWRDRGAADAAEDTATYTAWRHLADEVLRLDLSPLASRGQWARQQPFGDPTPHRHDGPVVALTRARIRPSRALRFWRSVPPVSTDLHRSPGLRLAIGVGEAPVGLQGTLSLWDSARDLVAFAARGAPHAEVVRRTPLERWYAEELFARFAVLSVTGTYHGRTP
jgi:hypothetical protein